MRELRNRGAQVLQRVAAGATITVTSDGARVAELRPLPRRALSTRELIERRRLLPAVDLESLRADIDDVVDPSL